jgi:hypothetical protein
MQCGQRHAFEVAVGVARPADLDYSTGYDKFALSFPVRRGRMNGAMMSGETYEMASGGSTGSQGNEFSDGWAPQLNDTWPFDRLVAAGWPTAVGWTQPTSCGNPYEGLTLLCQYMAANFKIQSNGVTGAMVTDPLVPATHPCLPAPTIGLCALVTAAGTPRNMDGSAIR